MGKEPPTFKAPVKAVCVNACSHDDGNLRLPCWTIVRLHRKKMNYLTLDAHSHSVMRVNSRGVMNKVLVDSDTTFRALADPTRRAIFERLCRQGEQTVTMMTSQAGISQPAVSKHVRLLRKAGLVSYRQDGRHTHYRPELAALAPLLEWTSKMSEFWQGRFDKLENLLREMD